MGGTTLRSSGETLCLTLGKLSLRKIVTGYSWDIVTDARLKTEGCSCLQLAAGAQEVAIFGAASESFSR